jgi:hypothetical protein
MPLSASWTRRERELAGLWVTSTPVVLRDVSSYHGGAFGNKWTLDADTP